MKTTLLLLVFTFLSFYSFAQVPQGVSYQAVAFNSGGAAVTNGNVGVKVSILDNSATGTAVYSETHVKTTNAQGLFNLNIGQGTATVGNFSTINWGNNSKFLKVEVDPTGGTNYTIIGTNELMSVPYALYAGSVADSGTGGASINDQIIEEKSANFAFDDYAANIIYVFNSKMGVWASQSYNQNSSPTIIESRGNFIFDDYAANIIYIFNVNTGTWVSQSYNQNSSPTIDIDSILGNFAFDDYADNIIYAFNAGTGIWVPQAYNQNTSPTLLQSKGNLAFDDYASNIIYVFNSSTGTWISQSYNQNTSPTIIESNGNFIFDDYASNIIYVFNANTGGWTSQSYNQNTSPTIDISETD